MTRRALVIALLLGRVASADPAPARVLTPADEARAQGLFTDGTKHYDLGEWDDAIASFKQAYAIMPDARFLFDIAQSYRRADDCRQARDFYQAYLRNAPADDGNRAKADKFLIDLEPCARHADEAARAQAQAQATARTDAPAAIPSEPPLTRLHVAGITTAGVGLVLAIAGGALSWRAHDAAAKITSACADGCVASEVRSLDERGRASQTDATILYAVSAAAILSGAGMYLWAQTRPRDTIAIAPAPGGAIVSAHLEF